MRDILKLMSEDAELKFVPIKKCKVTDSCVAKHNSPFDLRVVIARPGSFFGDKRIYLTLL